jgi:tRNA-Thr(GGU) m(6)t(6)A37 methyltransferase TsaA
MKEQHENPRLPQDGRTSRSENPPLKIIARIRTDLPSKFGIPRQSGLVDALKAVIVFEPEYRNPDALRGLEGFSHIWLIWEFSEAVRDTWSPTVRPPRLGGNTRMGVFATRSPFRPNPIGLSSVKLDRIELHPDLGPVLHVSGADLMDNTPIYDIKPYLPFTDSHPEATGGFADPFKDYMLDVDFPEQLLNRIPAEHHAALLGVLARDPRPSYQNDPERIYGLEFAGFNIRFTVKGTVLSVCEVTAL